MTVVGRFSELLPWKSLNEILRHHRLNAPRLRLVKNAEPVSEKAYLRYVTSRRGEQVPRLIWPEVARNLREGATLIVDAIDELYPPLTLLVERLETTFHESIQVNAYLAFGHDRGFTSHWDDHDVIVLQIVGAKQWTIFGEARRFPSFYDVVANPTCPTNKAWEHTLNPGDFLYIPRGWWHVAEPTGVPTLHLTIGINNRTGIDLIRWLADQMREFEIFRQDLPRFRSAEERVAHTRSLRSQLLAECRDDLLDRYFSSYDAQANVRPAPSLPTDAILDIDQIPEHAMIRFISPRALRSLIDVTEDRVSFEMNGKKWTFAAAAAPILTTLIERGCCTVADLHASSSAVLDLATLHKFMIELVREGLISIES